MGRTASDAVQAQFLDSGILFVLYRGDKASVCSACSKGSGLAGWRSPSCSPLLVRDLPPQVLGVVPADYHLEPPVSCAPRSGIFPP